MAVRAITDQGRTLELGRRLDDGGEGVVYEVNGAPLVAKLLIQPAAPADPAGRLASLVRRSRTPRMARLLAGEPRRVAWPTAAIRVLLRRPAAGYIHGYLMPDMRRWYRPLNYLLRPALRTTGFPDARWDTSLTASASLARLVADLHTAGYVIGDLKPENLWVDTTGKCRYFGCGFFPIHRRRKMFPCRVRDTGLCRA